jgi:hypothetical protein
MFVYLVVLRRFNSHCLLLQLGLNCHKEAEAHHIQHRRGDAVILVATAVGNQYLKKCHGSYLKGWSKTVALW